MCKTLRGWSVLIGFEAAPSPSCHSDPALRERNLGLILPITRRNQSEIPRSALLKVTQRERCRGTPWRAPTPTRARMIFIPSGGPAAHEISLPSQAVGDVGEIHNFQGNTPI